MTFSVTPITPEARKVDISCASKDESFIDWYMIPKDFTSSQLIKSSQLRKFWHSAFRLGNIRKKLLCPKENPPGPGYKVELLLKPKWSYRCDHEEYVTSYPACFCWPRVSSKSQRNFKPKVERIQNSQAGPACWDSMLKEFCASWSQEVWCDWTSLLKSLNVSSNSGEVSSESESCPKEGWEKKKKKKQIRLKTNRPPAN